MTVTLYHRQDGAWRRTVFPRAWARWNLGAAHSPGFSRLDQGESLILLPAADGVTIAPEDGVLPGAGPEITPAPLKNQLPEVRIVREAVLHAPGSALDHWEVKAR